MTRKTYVKNAVFLTLLLLGVFSLSGCLQEGDESTASTAPGNGEGGGVVNLGFSGIATIQDLDANTIRLTWAAASSAETVGYRVYEVSADGELSAIQTLDKSNLAFTHTGLVLGTTHSYVVRAVDKYGNSDGNMIIKSIHTFGGASSVSITGLNTATVYISNTSTAFSAMNIYYKAKRSGAWTLAGSTTNSALLYNVTGLKSGTTYEFRVRAENSSGIEDSNPVVAEGQTYSHSFNPAIPLTEKYQGVILAQAYGASPNAPTGTPQTRQVTIVWNNFFPSALPGDPSSSYAVVRALKGETIDMGTTEPCTTTTTTSCLIGTLTLQRTDASGSLTDTNVGAPPVKYDYAISWMSDTNWPEELPTTGNEPYRITVPVPPDNMILVHRDSVNYEQCKLMGKTPLPKENNRCNLGSTMWGAVPYNKGPGASPLGLDPQYYDFGYNLFVDRYTLACNWTAGNGYNGGPYYGSGANPNAAYGNNNDVYYRTDNGQCFIKVSGTWRDANYNTATCNYTAGNGYGGGAYTGAVAPDDLLGSNGSIYRRTSGSPACYMKVAGTWMDATANPTAYSYGSNLTATQYGLLATIDPGANGGHRPPLVYISQNQSKDACGGQYAPYYGYKRLLRHREYIAAAAWPYFDGEPNKKTDTEINAYEAASGADPHGPVNGANGGYRCNTNNHSGITAGAFMSTNLAGDAGDVVKSFVIGSLETSGCMSRFGLQDHVGNVWQWNSDQLRCRKDASSQPTDVTLTNNGTCVGVTSPLDSGNKDLQGFMFDGANDGPGGVGTTEWAIEGGNFNASYFNTALGLPMINDDAGNAVTISTFRDSSNQPKLHGDRFYLNVDNGSSSRGVPSGGPWTNTPHNGRWVSTWGPTPWLYNSLVGVRCAVPAE